MSSTNSVSNSSSGPIFARKYSILNIESDENNKTDPSHSADAATDPETRNKFSADHKLSSELLRIMYKKIYAKNLLDLKVKVRKSNFRDRTLLKMNQEEMFSYVDEKSIKELEKKVKEISIQIEQLEGEPLTPERALDFARSNNIDFFFDVSWFDPVKVIGSEEEEIQRVIDRDVTLLNAHFSVMTREKSLPMKVVVSKMNKAAKKIIKKVFLIKKHFSPGVY